MGIPRAHSEHREGHAGCSLGHYFEGIKSPHPHPVLPPIGETDAEAVSTVQIEDDESAFPEGRELFKLHRYHERDRTLSQRAKTARLARVGALSCDVCGFDFSMTYGELGDGFIEAHHRVPVAQLAGKLKTKVSDLALVCANCHRMLHRADPQLTVEALQAKLTATVSRQN
jgi:predicted HNH restriction endonuclease